MPGKVASYVLPHVRIADESEERMTLGPAGSPRFVVYGASGVFAFISLVLFFSGPDLMLWSLLPFALAAAYASNSPLHNRLTIDGRSRQLIYSAEYLLRRQRQVEVRAPLAQVVRAAIAPRRLSVSLPVEIALADGTRFTARFEHRAAEAERFTGRLRQQALAEPESLLDSPRAAAAAATTETQSALRRELRSWSFALLILGVFQIVSAQSLSPWGIVLIGVGLASFYFHSAPLFIVYAVIVGWASLQNLLYADLLWNGFALLQAYWSFRLVQQFRRFHPAEQAELAGLAEPEAANAGADRSRRLFPWLALGLGLSSLALYVLVVLIAFLEGALSESAVTTNALPYLETLAVYAGLLGLGMGLGGWLAAYPRRLAALAGGVAGALTLLAEVAIALLAGLS